MDQFTEISFDRVVDGIIHYRGRTHIVLESTLREEIMRAMYDSILTGNYRYLYEYESLQVTGLLSREAFRLHEFLKYSYNDQGSIFFGAVW